MNLKLTIAYDGTHFLGWQKTKEGRSIEATLQTAIEQVVRHPAPLQAASRTDAGVHAKAQVVNFICQRQDIELLKLQHSLNCILPKEIAVLDIEEMPPSFHPTLDCTGKCYRYFLCKGAVQLPWHRLYSWHVPGALDIAAMQQALPYFVGAHDFKSFCNAKKNETYENYVRTVMSLELDLFENDRLSFTITGNHFLYKMVRNIVGTLVDIGKKKMSAEEVPGIIASRKRTTAGVTAPAHGLFLEAVFFSDKTPSA